MVRLVILVRLFLILMLYNNLIILIVIRFVIVSFFMIIERVCLGGVLVCMMDFLVVVLISVSWLLLMIRFLLLLFLSVGFLLIGRFVWFGGEIGVMLLVRGLYFWFCFNLMVWKVLCRVSWRNEIFIMIKGSKILR